MKYYDLLYPFILAAASEAGCPRTSSRKDYSAFLSQLKIDLLSSPINSLQGQPYLPLYLSSWIRSFFCYSDW